MISDTLNNSLGKFHESPQQMIADILYLLSRSNFISPFIRGMNIIINYIDIIYSTSSWHSFCWLHCYGSKFYTIGSETDTSNHWPWIIIKNGFMSWMIPWKWLHRFYVLVYRFYRNKQFGIKSFIYSCYFQYM